MNRLSFDFVRQANSRSFCNRRVTDQRRLNFCGAETVTRDLDHIVHAANNPEVTIRVALGRVTCGVAAGVLRPVLIDIALVITVNSAQHGRPRIQQSEIAFCIVGDRVALFVHDLGFLTKEGACTRTGLERHHRSRRNHKIACLCLPPGIHDRTLLFANNAVIPLPCLRVDRFTYRAEQAQGRKIVLVRPRFAEAHESTNGGGCGIEDRNSKAFDHLPPAVRVRECRAAFEQHRSRASDHRTVYDVGVTRDPTGVSRTPPAVFIFHIEDILERGVCADHVAAVRVQDGFRFARGAGCVKNEKRIFRIEDFGCAFAVGDRE